MDFDFHGGGLTLMTYIFHEYCLKVKETGKEMNI